MTTIKLVKAENPERYQADLAQLWRSIHRKVADEMEGHLKRIFEGEDSPSIKRGNGNG